MTNISLALKVDWKSQPNDANSRNWPKLRAGFLSTVLIYTLISDATARDHNNERQNTIETEYMQSRRVVSNDTSLDEVTLDRCEIHKAVKI